MQLRLFLLQINTSTFTPNNKSNDIGRREKRSRRRWIHSTTPRDGKNRRFVLFPKGITMNANSIITDDMTLEQKLAAIDAAMANAQAQANDEAAANGTIAAPIDPALLTICDGCE